MAEDFKVMKKIKGLTHRLNGIEEQLAESFKNVAKDVNKLDNEFDEVYAAFNREITTANKNWVWVKKQVKSLRSDVDGAYLIGAITFLGVLVVGAITVASTDDVTKLTVKTRLLEDRIAELEVNERLKKYDVEEEEEE